MTGHAKDAADQLALDESRARFHRSDIVLVLNNFDEQIELRRLDFLKIELVDPLNQYSRRLDPLRLAYKEVLGLRDTIEREDRVLTDGEIKRLDALNADLEHRVYEIKSDLLAKAGPSAPRSMEMILRQVTAGTFGELQKLDVH